MTYLYCWLTSATETNNVKREMYFEFAGKNAKQEYLRLGENNDANDPGEAASLGVGNF